MEHAKEEGTGYFYGRYGLEPQNAREAHILNVYKDPDFIRDIAILRPDRSKLLKAIEVKNTIDEKIKILRVLENVDPVKVKELAKQYAITEMDIILYVGGQNEAFLVYRPNMGRPYSLKINFKGEITARFNVSITKLDFLEMWKSVASRKRIYYSGTIPQPKIPEHTKLLYAIFKGRQRGEKYREIYDQYKAKVLPYFEGEKPTEFNSLEKFAQYFRDHKPNPNPPSS